MLNENHVTAAHAAVVAGAEGLRTGEAPYLETVRNLNSLGHKLAKDIRVDPDFVIFLAIDSETDHLPTAGMRASCDPLWLATCDEEIAKIEALYRERVTKACEALITRFGAG